MVRAMGVALMAVALPCVGCATPSDSIQIMLDRHARAVAKLSVEKQQHLLPCGPSATTEQVASLLPPGQLRLADARSVAIRANPDVHAALARLEAARAAITEARAPFLPTLVAAHDSVRTLHTPASRNRLNASLQQPSQAVPADVDVDVTQAALTTFLNALRRPLFPVSKQRGNRNSFSEHSTSLTLSWTVFDGFVREARLLAAKYQYEASELALADVQRFLIQAVDTAYYQAQLAKEQLRIARADEAFSREQLVEKEKRQAAGQADLAEVGNFRVRVLAAQADVMAAIGLKETWRVALAELMGLPDSMLPVDSVYPPLAEETESEMTVPDPKPWIERALSSRPDLLELEALAGAQRERLRAAKGAYSPVVGVSGSWGFDRSSNLRYTFEDQSSAAAVQVRWDLYTGGVRRGRRLGAQANLAAAQAQVNRRRLAVQAEVRKAIIELNDARQQILLHRENVSTAMENRRIVEVGYRAGKETLNRLNETQRDYIATDAALVQARIRLRQAWTDLRAAAGTHEPLDGVASNQ